MVTEKRLQEIWETFVGKIGVEAQKKYIESLSEDEQFEFRNRVLMEEREKHYPEPVRRAWKQEFDGADTDKKFEMLYDALSEALMDIAVLKAQNEAMSEMFKHFAK